MKDEEKLMQQIADMEAKLAEMKATLEKKHWQPEGGPHLVGAAGDVTYVNQSYSQKEDATEFGTLRRTKDQAEKAAEKMRQFNRLLAYVDEACGGYDYVVGQNNYSVFFSNGRNPWDYTNSRFAERRVDVYMPKQVAIELVEKLNSGEVVL